MRLEDRECYKRLRDMADNGDQQAQQVLRSIASCSGPGKYATPQYSPPSAGEIREHRSREIDRVRLRQELMRRLM